MRHAGKSKSTGLSYWAIEKRFATSRQQDIITYTDEQRATNCMDYQDVRAPYLRRIDI